MQNRGKVHDLRLVLAELPDLEMGKLQWMTWDASALLLRLGILARSCRRPVDCRFNGSLPARDRPGAAPRAPLAGCTVGRGFGTRTITAS